MIMIEQMILNFMRIKQLNRIQTWPFGSVLVNLQQRDVLRNMDKEDEILELRHRRFVSQAAETQTIWGLTNTKRWATSSSSFFRNEEAMPFWSQEKDATACAKDEWKGYHAGAIPLGEFLENWSAGLYEDNFLIGTNWDSNLIGKELEPLDLVLELIEELKSQKKDIQLDGFASLEELEEQIRAMIAEE
jgi:Protein of unknown function (DUF2750)